MRYRVVIEQRDLEPLYNISQSRKALSQIYFN